MLLLAVLAAASTLLGEWSEVAVRGWTHDGSAVAWEATIESREKPDGVVPCSRVFLLVTDPEGRTLGVYRLRSQVPMEEVTWIAANADSLWNAARGEEEAKSWLRTHPLLSATHPRPLEGRLEVASGHEKLRVSQTLESPSSCPAVRLRVETMDTRTDVARDDCPLDEAPGKGFSSSLQVGWAPDGRRAALAWNTTRPSRGGEVKRGHFAVVSRRPR